MSFPLQHVTECYLKRDFLAGFFRSPGVAKKTERLINSSEKSLFQLNQITTTTKFSSPIEEIMP